MNLTRFRPGAIIPALTQSVARRFGYQLSPIHHADTADVSPEEWGIWETVRPFTMTSLARVVTLVRAIRFTVEHGHPGAIVECGVWRGGSMMAVALTLRALGVERELYLFDTFAGMTAPAAVDSTIAGESAGALLSEPEANPLVVAAATLQEVQQNLARTGYPMAKIHCIVGSVEDTIPARAPDEIALLRLDTDWYASTLHELNHLYARVAPRGLIIIDDYGHWNGAKRAVDEFLGSLPVTPFLHRIDYTGRAFAKPL
jgi:O-methyltransferase